ncbi:carboxylesterase family protein [Loigolactobacillus binensis]|uniref:Prolyl oligopeptidase family serine peptidase n=1 Tax=Loigolactobacillus binensis TaxID=2559922 RepID=A0ABW3EH06_9LACO|nr:prolyl oligopeptidase family serine peptidase [Loigolactobacillus binensis]
MKRHLLTSVTAALFLMVTLAACSTNNSANKSSSSSSTATSKASSSSSFKKTNTDDAKTDPALTSVLAETESKFKQLSFKDSKTGVTLQYNLYVPANYTSKKSYPMVSFIHDDSVTGQSVKTGLTQGYGGTIWATATEQAKHASFVLVPVFSTSTIAGGMGQSGSAVVKAQVQTYLDLVKTLENKYSIDKDRLYGTGQSMGGMTMFYLNSHYPNLFAATLYVSSQWDVKQLAALKKQKFFYIVSGGDSTASAGQTNLLTYLKQNKVAYTHTTLSASASTATKNTAVNKLLAQKAAANFITWDATLASGQTLDHNTSFDYGYTIPAVRDWLFNQHK